MINIVFTEKGMSHHVVFLHATHETACKDTPLFNIKQAFHKIFAYSITINIHKGRFSPHLESNGQAQNRPLPEVPVEGCAGECALAGLRVRTHRAESAHSQGRECALANRRKYSNKSSSIHNATLHTPTFHQNMHDLTSFFLHLSSSLSLFFCNFAADMACKVVNCHTFACCYDIHK